MLICRSGLFYIIVIVFFTLTDRASTIPSNIRGCQSGRWSQRGNKVNGSHHGDNPLLRPTGIQIATISLCDLRPSNASSTFRWTTVFGIFWIMLKTSLLVALSAFLQFLTQTFLVTFTLFLLSLHTDAVSNLHLLPLLYITLYGPLFWGRPYLSVVDILS